MRTLTLLGTLSMLAFTAGTANADLLAYDGFEDYTTGNNLTGGSQGTGWTSNWLATSGETTVAAKSMVYSNGGVTVDGGSKVVKYAGPGGDPKASRTFAAREPDDGPIYFSFLAQVGDPPADESALFAQWYLSNDADDRDSGSIAMWTGAAPSQTNYISARITNTAGSSTQDQLLGNFDGSLVFVVGRLSGDGTSSATNFDKMDLYFNPSSLTEPGSPSKTIDGDSGTASVDTLGLRIAGGGWDSESTDIAYFDEFRIGTTYASVVVPEPGTLALALMAAFGLLAWRRR